jgi:hypothetical protein
MNNIKVKLEDIPNTVDIKITEKLTCYSVALGIIRNGNPQTFQPLGAGTLVRKGKRYGILTAHHCLHAISPELALGTVNSDFLFCAIKDSRVIGIKNYEISEIQLSYPPNKNYGEYGPDLTFIDIPNPRLSTFKALLSFWNLDIDINKLNREFVKSGHIIANTGYPCYDENYKIEIKDNTVNQRIKFMSFISDMSKGHIKNVNGWDYIDADCYYNRAEGLPCSFAGLSGGGIWSIRLKFEKDTKEWDIDNFALIGVTFYESPIKDGMRFLRGHFIDSIYNHAWNNIQKN